MYNLKVLNIQNLNVFLISVLPIGLVFGSLISNLIIITICIFFILELFFKKDLFYLNQKNFYFLIIINLYIFLNSFFISDNNESIIKSLGFFRFIILAYAISYYFNKSGDYILKIWSLFFLIVSFDIIFEYIFGKNIFGFESLYDGRLASFTNDEYKIGGYYFGFIFLCLLYLKQRKDFLFLTFTIIFLLISLLIGERSNFIKVFMMYLIFFLFFYEISFIKKISVILVFTLLTTLFIFSVPSFKIRFIDQIFNKILIKVDQTNKKEKIYKDIISNNRHLSHYYIASKIIKENTLFGSGFKSFRIESFKEKYQEDKIDGASTHPHQFHFEILSELGLIGYVLIISNIFYVLFRNFSLKNDFMFKSAFLFIIVSLVPFLPSGSFFTSYGATIFFINYSFLIRPNVSNKLKNQSE
tara:strand:- start:3914 stop:5152 length:1239 start_codon:yes stop_codon:yes gene_type:complete